MSAIAYRHSSKSLASLFHRGAAPARTEETPPLVVLKLFSAIANPENEHVFSEAAALEAFAHIELDADLK